MNSREYYRALLDVRDGVDPERRTEFDQRYFASRKNQTHIFVFSLFLGWLGVDRFALGQPVTGILKLLTVGGLFIWYIVDLFLVGSSARRKNIRIARDKAQNLVAEGV